jgi:hypothetical protein
VRPKTAQACALAGGAGPRKSNSNSSRNIVLGADNVKMAPLLRFLRKPDFKDFLRAFPTLLAANSPQPAEPAFPQNSKQKSELELGNNYEAKTKAV